jgi:hypothetical protein
MNKRALLSMALSLLALAVAAPARADNPQPPAIAPPPPPLPLPMAPLDPMPAAAQPSPVDESVFRAVVGRPVELQLASGQTVSGQLFSLEAGNAALALPDGQVVTVRCADVVSLRLAHGGAAKPVKGKKDRDHDRDRDREKEKPEQPESDPALRHFGLMFGAGPGVLAADFHYGYFYGFLSTSIVLPMYAVGTNSNGLPIDGVTVAPGLTFRMAPDRNWWFDLFVHGTLSFYYHYDNIGRNTQVDVDTSFGLGMGFHYTSPNGFTVGIKIPVFGFAFGNDVKSPGRTGGLASSGQYYYEGALVSFPLVTFGYRF